MPKLTIMVPVQVEATSDNVRELWRELRGAVHSCRSSLGWSYVIRADKVTLKSLRLALMLKRRRRL